ncbi:MAG: PAS domain-containing protein [Proteobacteria bacterium]|nr:PAS domain-containing protein [Pseudomonadota bacterium]
MRINLPVSSQEYPFPHGHTLVSTTDTKGRILYCNPMFIEVSGYSREELLGQPHNIVRHPDMPEEAYRDMWQTIASGKPWSAPVKNRRKNGDYYWVMANATPLMEDGRAVGYMSVRTEATRAQVQAAERLYATMRAERQAGRERHRFSGARLVRSGWAGRLGALAHTGLPARLALTMGALLLGSQAIAMLLPGGSLAASTLAWLLYLGLFGGAWWFLARMLVGPLARLTATANRLAAGDLTQQPEPARSDELGQLQQALGQLSVNLRSIVRDARDQSSAMVLGTGEIAQGNQDLSQRTETQAGNLQQTASAMEQITGTVQQTAESAQQASRLAAQTQAITERSHQAVNEVGGTMNAIQRASQRIGEITQVIDAIAFQTNILALNAAVEAARAGEQGRGFAVVAAEVRALAQRSAQSAKEIKQLIEDAARTVRAGHETTEVARQTMAEMLASVRQMGALVDEISHATGEQLSGISMVNGAVAQLDGITQQNAAMVEQMAAAAQSLQGQARATSETVQVFRLEAGTPHQAPNAVALRRQYKSPAMLAH